MRLASMLARNRMADRQREREREREMRFGFFISCVCGCEGQLWHACIKDRCYNLMM